MTLDANRKPRVGVVAQRPHQARGSDLGVDFVIIGSEFDLDRFFVHFRSQGLDRAVGAFDARDLAGELGSLATHLRARPIEVADHFVVEVKLKLLLVLRGTLQNVGFSYGLRRK